MGAEREYKAMADQLTTAAQERLRNQIGVLTPGEMKAIERVIRIQLGMQP
jgi:mRNA-degrading endonuclease toxin of MazEF toxin-antitoxin module